jgi:hypothetical protein
MSKRETILEEAQRLMHGERNKNYGHPRENFSDIGALFSAYLEMPITDIDVANLMIWSSGPRQRDRLPPGFIHRHGRLRRMC